MASFDAVIDPDCNGRPASRSDQIGGLVDCLGTTIRRGAAANAAAGAVHGGPSFAEGAGNASTGAAGCAGDDGDAPGQGQLRS